MKLTDETIKQGVSEVGVFRMNYTITYNGENEVLKIESQMKRLPTESNGEVYSGHAFFVTGTNHYSFQLTSNVLAEERKALLNDFEKTLEALT